MGAQLIHKDHPNLQIQPDKEIIIEYIRNEDFKYVRMLGASLREHAGAMQPVGRADQLDQGLRAWKGGTTWACSLLAVLRGMAGG